MGKIKDLYGFSLLENATVNDVQKYCIENIDLIFKEYVINNISKNVEIGIGERGKYYGKQNVIHGFSFVANELFFHIFLCYDQFEFTILRNTTIVENCIVEDFSDDMYVVADFFLKHLKKCLIKQVHNSHKEKETIFTRFFHRSS